MTTLLDRWRWTEATLTLPTLMRGMLLTSKTLQGGSYEDGRPMGPYTDLRAADPST